MTVLVTGAAGFIGFHVAKRFLEQKVYVIGLDGFTEYYDVKLKRDRVDILSRHKNFKLIEAKLEDADHINRVVSKFKPELIIHLAAQAGVRYSFEDPGAYINSNLVGTANLLEAIKNAPPKHFMFASTSSVYGSNPWQPFRETDRTDFPASLYAATKRAGEALTHAYAHLYQIPTTCFRFFTVYGPWGRPDMALFKFVSQMQNNEPIEVYGQGKMVRDFTYIDDLVDAILGLTDRIPAPNIDPEDFDSSSPTAPWRIVNLGGGSPRSLIEFIEIIEENLGVKAHKNLLPMQPGDVRETNASPLLLNKLISNIPETPLEIGISSFVAWYKKYYGE